MFELLPEDLVRLILGRLTDIAKLGSAVCNHVFRTGFLLCTSRADVYLLVTMRLKHLVPFFRWLHSRKMTSDRHDDDFILRPRRVYDGTHGGLFDRMSAHVVTVLDAINRPVAIRIFTNSQPVLDLLDAIVKTINAFPSLERIEAVSIDKQTLLFDQDMLAMEPLGEDCQFCVQLQWDKSGTGTGELIRTCQVDFHESGVHHQIQGLLILLSFSDVVVRRFLCELTQKLSGASLNIVEISC